MTDRRHNIKIPNTIKYIHHIYFEVCYNGPRVKGMQRCGCVEEKYGRGEGGYLLFAFSNKAIARQPPCLTAVNNYFEVLIVLF